MTKTIVLTLILMSFLSCDRDEINQDQNSRENPQDVNIVKKKQRTIRYDCDENITSDRLETLNLPIKSFQIKPKIKRNVYSFDASNGFTERGALVDSIGVFGINLSPTIFNLRAYPGLNAIDYNFKYCNRLVEQVDNRANRSSRTRKVCAHEPVTKETGSLYLYITISTEEVPGIREVKKSPKDCN